MIPVFINGLIPGDTSIVDGDNGGSIVGIFDADYPRENNQYIVFVGYANGNGEIHTKIDDKYINKILLLRIRDSGTKPIEAMIKCENYGLFYTAKIVIDNGGINEVQANWNTDKNHAKAQEEMHDFIKKHKYYNRWIKLIYYFILVSSVFLSLYFSNWLGILVAACVIIVLEIIAPYAIGLKPFSLTRRSSWPL